jgi:hypothetical protein
MLVQAGDDRGGIPWTPSREGSQSAHSLPLNECACESVLFQIGEVVTFVIRKSATGHFVIPNKHSLRCEESGASAMQRAFALHFWLASLSTDLITQESTILRPASFYSAAGDRVDS